MYQAELSAFLPGTEQKVKIIASCRNINNYDVIGLTLKFYNEENEVMFIEYDKDFFADIEQEAIDALLEDYYNNTLGYMM